MCRENRMSKGDMKKFLVMPLFAASLLVSGCVPKVNVHGYVPVPEVVASLAVGDTQESVATRMGRPTSTGLEGTNTWYYISSKVRQVAFLAPREIERQIVAISFSGNRVVLIENFGLEDGRIVNLNTNETVTEGRRLTFFEQFLGNIGNFSAESFIGG